MKVSNCCGAKDLYFKNGGTYSDHGVCPTCKEHCEFVEERKPDYYVEQWGGKDGSVLGNTIWNTETLFKIQVQQTQGKDFIQTHATFRVYLKKQSA